MTEPSERGARTRGRACIARIAVRPVMATLAALAAACGPATGLEPRSAYVPSADGTRLAVDAYVPLEAAEAPEGATREADASATRWPAVLRITRRWRDFELVRRPGIGPPRAFEVDTFTAAGYALVLADARGTGASFGARAGPPGPWDAADIAALLDWVVAQPWSNGRVAAWGEGDDAAFAELAAASGHPAVRVAIVRFGEHDLYSQLAHPGGVPNRRLLGALGREARLLDAGDPCAFVPDETRCDEVDVLFRGPRPVDGDREALAAALAEHGDGRARWLASAAEARGRDDELADPSPVTPQDGTGPGPIWPATLDAASDLGRYDAVLESDVPIQRWAGWLDGGTADAALARLSARRWHDDVIVAPLGHRGLEVADPLGGPNGEAQLWSIRSQFGRMITFLDANMDARGAGPSSRSSTLDIIPLGGVRMALGRRWPPERVPPVRYALHPDGSLVADRPLAEPAEVVRRLARDPGGGAAGRWASRFDEPIDYAGPAPDDPAAAAFTTGRFPFPVVVAGHPVVTVTASIGLPEGVIHAYLEVVDEEGDALMVSDGGLALAHRAPAGPAPFDAFSARHSFAMADRLATPPGDPAELAIRLWPIAARLEMGQRLRITLVGGTLAAPGPGVDTAEASLRLVLDARAALAVPIIVLPEGALAPR